MAGEISTRTDRFPAPFDMEAGRHRTFPMAFYGTSLTTTSR
jgi:hypothetical protein